MIRPIIRQTANNLGLYNPAQDSGEGPRPLGRSLGFLLFAICLFGAVVFYLTWMNLGVGIAAISTLIAFITAGFYLMIFLWLDRFDPEPARTLALAFGWGATVAVFFSGMINDGLGAGMGEWLSGVALAPIIEESCKGVGVLIIALCFHEDFDSVVDGIVYAGVIALGFATMENIDYYGRSLAHGGMNTLLGTFIIRGVLAPFSHVLFTSTTGIGLGIARETHHRPIKILAPIAGYLLAIFSHAIWNMLASFDGGTFFTGYILFEIPLFLSFIVIIAYLVKREGAILKRTLLFEVDRGLITSQQLEITISVFRRTSWVAAAFGDSRRFNARRRYLRAIAKLGLCHWHNARALEADKNTSSFALVSRLQAEIFDLRNEVEANGGK